MYHDMHLMFSDYIKTEAKTFDRLDSYNETLLLLHAELERLDPEKGEGENLGIIWSIEDTISFLEERRDNVKGV